MSNYLKMLLFFVFSLLTACGDDTDNKVEGKSSVGVVHTGQGGVNITTTNIPIEKFVILSQELGVTQSALKSFFKILEQKQVPSEDLDSTLRVIAQNYKDLQTRMTQLTSDDPAVQEIREKAKVAIDKGEFSKAEDLLTQAEKLDEEVINSIEAEMQRMQDAIDKRKLSLAASKAVKGDMKETQLAYAEAADFYQQAIDLVPQGYDDILSDYLMKYGNAKTLAGQYAEAGTAFHRSLVLREQVFGEENTQVADTLNALVNLYNQQGKYEQAKSLCRRGLGIRERILGKEHPDVASSLGCLGVSLYKQGKYGEAKPLYEQALAIYEKVHGKEHPDVATSLNNLAGLYDSQGKYAEAEPLYQRALAIKEKIYGNKHPSIATSLNNLAELHRVQGKYAEAEPLYEKALGIRKRELGEEHPDVATSLNNLAALHDDLGNYTQALPLYERAIAIWEKVYGEVHPQVAIGLNNLAGLYEAQGKYAEAEPLHLRALAIREKVFGNEHEDTIASLYHLAKLYQRIGEHEKATPLLERAAVNNVENILGHLMTEQKAQVTEILEVKRCSCGCGMNVMQCLVEDPACSASKAIARSVIEELFPDKHLK